MECTQPYNVLLGFGKHTLSHFCSETASNYNLLMQTRMGHFTQVMQAGLPVFHVHCSGVWFDVACKADNQIVWYPSERNTVELDLFNFCCEFPELICFFFFFNPVLTINTSWGKLTFFNNHGTRSPQPADKCQVAYGGDSQFHSQWLSLWYQNDCFFSAALLCSFSMYFMVLPSTEIKVTYVYCVLKLVYVASK